MQSFIFGYGSTVVTSVNIVPTDANTPKAFGIGLIDIGFENSPGETPTDERLAEIGLFKDGQFDPDRFETVLWFTNEEQRDAVKTGLTGLKNRDFVLLPTGD